MHLNLGSTQSWGVHHTLKYIPSEILVTYSGGYLFHIQVAEVLGPQPHSNLRGQGALHTPDTGLGSADKAGGGT